jgi:hypothetical protein
VVTSVLKPDQKKSRLERLIERRHARDAAASARYAKTKVLETKKKDRFAEEEFKQSFRKMFARLRKLVKCTYAKEARAFDFDFKNHDCRITFEHYHIPQEGVDTWDIDGDSWKLMISMRGSHEIVDLKDIVTGKDYTATVIELLKQNVRP